MTIPVRFGLEGISITKPPFLEWKDGSWRVWTAYNTDLSAGTYFELTQSGNINRVTIQCNEIMDVTHYNTERTGYHA